MAKQSGRLVFELSELVEFEPESLTLIRFITT